MNIETTCSLAELSDGSRDYVLDETKYRYNVGKWRADCEIVAFHQYGKVQLNNNNTVRHCIERYGFISDKEQVGANIACASDALILDSIALNHWIFAKTMPESPHYYALRKQWQGDVTFNHMVQIIRNANMTEEYKGVVYNVMQIGAHVYWSMGAPTSITILINRKDV